MKTGLLGFLLLTFLHKEGLKWIVIFTTLWIFSLLFACSRKTEMAPDFLCPGKELLSVVPHSPVSADAPIIPEILARNCPDLYRDGLSQPPDMNVRSCHTRFSQCQDDESPLNCGKRALMAGDWEQAVRAFAAAGNSCEAIYGSYLSRLFRLYANYNNLFFSDILEKNYNKNHLTRDLNVPLNPEADHYYSHYSCLANEVYKENDFSTKSLIDEYLERIWEKECELRGPPEIKDGLLPIRWIQGRCDSPLFDTVFVGRWDRVDAVLIYQWLMGSPAETKRFRNFLAPSNTEPCNDPICQPLILGGVEIARLPKDSEWFLKFVRNSSQELFNPHRSRWGVFYWEDRNDNRRIDPADGVLARLCDPKTGNPTLNLEKASVAALWTYRKATVDRPGQRRINIFCGGTGACELLPGENKLIESEPVWARLAVQGTLAMPSPDGEKLAFLKEASPGIWHIYVTNNALNLKGEPECPSLNDDDCCVTCRHLPQGIQLSSSLPGKPGVIPDWIPDPNNPRGPALGLMFMHNEHPSAWGWGGQGHNGQYFAVRPDGSAFSRLLPGDIPFAMHYQRHISPDGTKLLWTSTWDPETGGTGPHNLLIGTIIYDSAKNEFRLENIHSVLKGLDHGWYEAHGFAPDYPRDRRIFFTSSSHSMQSPRGFMAVLDENDRAQTFYKLSWPDEVNPEPFMIDNHPAWNEHFFPVDHGRQIIFVSSDGSGSAAERYDWYLNFPPYFEGVLFGLTIYDIRFAGIGNTGYLSLTSLKSWISNVDGTSREILFKAAVDAGWTTFLKLLYRDRIYFAQKKIGTGETRYGYMDFPENP